MNGLNICPKCGVVIGTYGQCNCPDRSFRWPVILLVALLVLLAPETAQARGYTWSSATETPRVVIHGLDIEPVSGNWNYPDTFRIQNVTDAPITVRWLLDCYNPLHCESDNDVTVISPSVIIHLGLGRVCSGWQLDLWWQGAPPWGAVAEPENCPTSLPPGAEPIRLWLPLVQS